jgi:centractin
MDAGDGVSHAVPVYEGFAVPSSIRRIDVAGRDVTEYMQLLLRKSGFVFHTSAEKEVVRTIKEKTSYVALDPKKEEKDWLSVANRGQDSKIVEYVLPDGNKMKARSAYLSEYGKRHYSGLRLTPCSSSNRSAQSASEPLKFYSSQN